MEGNTSFATKQPDGSFIIEVPNGFEYKINSGRWRTKSHKCYVGDEIKIRSKHKPFTTTTKPAR